jgi:hypothetical protein
VGSITMVRGKQVGPSTTRATPFSFKMGRDLEKLVDRGVRLVVVVRCKVGPPQLITCRLLCGAGGAARRGDEVAAGRPSWRRGR